MNLYKRTTETDPETGRQHEREAAEVNLVGLDSKNGGGGWGVHPSSLLARCGSPAQCLTSLSPCSHAGPVGDTPVNLTGLL